VTADTVVDGILSTQGWNRYLYCHGNPIEYKDPTGHFIVPLLIGAAVLVATIVSYEKPAGEGENLNLLKQEFKNKSNDAAKSDNSNAKFAEDIGKKVLKKGASDLSGKIAETGSLAKNGPQVTEGVNQMWDKALKSGPVSQESVKKMAVAESLFKNDAVNSSKNLGSVVGKTTKVGIAAFSAGYSIYKHDQEMASENYIREKLQDVKKSGVNDMFSIKTANRLFNNAVSGKPMTKDFNSVATGK
jgi:hypothetical protein